MEENLFKVKSLQLVLCLSLLAVANNLLQSQEVPSNAPVHLTSEQDHQRVMDELHIGKLRLGANGRDPKAPDYASYDEAKANP